MWPHGHMVNPSNLCHRYGFCEDYWISTHTHAYTYPWPLPAQVSKPMTFSIGLSLSFAIRGWSLTLFLLSWLQGAQACCDRYCPQSVLVIAVFAHHFIAHIFACWRLESSIGGFIWRIKLKAVGAIGSSPKLSIIAIPNHFKSTLWWLASLNID